MVLARRLEDQFAAAEDTSASLGFQQGFATQVNPAKKSPPTFRAPADSSSDDESDDGSQNTNGARAQLRLSPAQQLLQAQQQVLQQKVAAAGQAAAQQLQQSFLQVEQELQRSLNSLLLDVQNKQSAWQEGLTTRSASAEAERQRLLAAARQQAQSQLAAAARAQQAAEAKAQSERLRKQQEAEAARKQHEQELARKQQAEQEAADAAAQEAARKEQQQQKQKQQPSQTASAAAAPAAGKPVSSRAATGVPPGVVVAAGAAEAAAELRRKLEAAEEQVQPLLTNPELRKQRRDLGKELNLLVASVSGTQQQVMSKVKQMEGILAKCTDETQRTYCCLELADRMLQQCDTQVARLSTFAFALGATCIGIGVKAPLFMDLLLAKLQKACMLVVPQYLLYSKGSSQDEWYSRMGYLMVDDPKTRQPQRETADQYIGRVTAYVHLLAAMVQTQWTPHPLPPAHGWRYLAWLLNQLPANRLTATALEAFMAHAGHVMYMQYRGQYVKLLQYIREVFLEELVAKSKDGKSSDTQAVIARLMSFMDGRLYQQPPAGAQLPQIDDSSKIKAGNMNYCRDNGHDD